MVAFRSARREDALAGTRNEQSLAWRADIPPHNRRDSRRQDRHVNVEFIANASVLICLRDGRNLLVDPWLSHGIYYGSWYNFPPLAADAIARYRALKPDYIYISHLHPDHLDPATLADFPASTPILIGDLGHDHLRRSIARLGFTDIRELPLGELVKLDGADICILPGFDETADGHVDETSYELDTSLWLTDQDGRQLFHAIDSPTKPCDAGNLRRRFGAPDIAFLPCAGASFYPHAFPRYDAATKRRHRDRVKSERLRAFCAIARALRPRVAVPCTGSYVMAGRIAHYTEYLHQGTPDEIAAAWERCGPQDVALRLLATGDVIDGETGTVVENEMAPFRRYSVDERVRYAGTLRDRPLFHDDIAIPECFAVNFARLLAKARANLWRHQQRLGVFPAVDLELIVEPSDNARGLARQQQTYSFRFDQETGPAVGDRPYLRFRIDAPLLLMALIGAANWNNIEIGALVECEREPDQHMPTLHSLMSFFVL